ncbi:MAG: hypothetical protein ACREL6_06330, partial [Gemmatimonadales bacterium]
MKRRSFLGHAGSSVTAAALGGLPFGRVLPPFARADYLLVPMDETQSDHLKAYGVAYRVLSRGARAEWLLNYRSGAFLLPADTGTARDAALGGVSTVPVDEGTALGIRAEIADANMDAIPLEKAPKVAVYVSPNAAPWDDAVTMALQYAGIEYDKLWDEDVLTGGLSNYDWLHLHHEDFTGQYSKFYLNYAGSPWLTEMVSLNQDAASRLNYPSVPALKRAVAETIGSYVER